MLLIPEREGIRQHARPVEMAFVPDNGWVFRFSYFSADLKTIARRRLPVFLQLALTIITWRYQ
jgi:hypothetical protein